MGDCRMKVIVSKNLNSSESTDDDTVYVKVYASDATVREVRDDFFGMLPLISIWDCTLYPPKDITECVLEQYPERSGMKSKTLFDAGCFPSAIWRVLPQGTKPSIRAIQEDNQYNRQEHEAVSISSSKVELFDQPSDAKPSEVLNSVIKRFKGDEEDVEAALIVRRQKLQERRAKEAARHAKLEGRIEKLEENKHGTSEQVRKMLLKSRCTGSKSLKMQDRIYLQVTMEKGDVLKQHFRYFSRQDTTARVLQTLASDVKPPQETELLVSISDKTYRRIPTTMRLYEAIENGFLKEVDSVVVRSFTPTHEELTTSILDQEEAAVESGESAMTDVVEDLPSLHIMKDSQIEETSCASLASELILRLDVALASVDSKAKKKSSTSTKVREILMKSKAKGDAKRIAKMEGRFFVELIRENGPSSFIFMSKKDTIERLLKENGSQNSSAYAVNGNGEYSQLSSESVLEDLESRNVLRSFGRLVVLQ